MRKRIIILVIIYSNIYLAYTRQLDLLPGENNNYLKKNFRFVTAFGTKMIQAIIQTVPFYELLTLMLNTTGWKKYVNSEGKIPKWMPNRWNTLMRTLWSQPHTIGFVCFYALRPSQARERWTKHLIKCLDQGHSTMIPRWAIDHQPTSFQCYADFHFRGSGRGSQVSHISLTILTSIPYP